MRTSRSRLLLIAGALLMLVACNGKSKDDSTVLATVNGTPITNNMFRAYVRTLAGGRDVKLTEQQHQQVLDRLIDMTVLAQEAEKTGLDKDSKVAAELLVQHEGLLAQSLVRDYLDKHPVTDADVKAEYAERTKNMPSEEYHARHILVSSEKLAKNIIAQLNKGADFAKLAKKYSSDGSKRQGGDLGWFSPDQMVPEFSKAVEQLKKGQYTRTPVHTQFGWHVIKLEGTRAAPTPSLDSARQEIENELKGKHVEAYVKGLRDTAKVNIPTPAAGSSAAAAKAAPAPQPADKGGK
ncbi:MAG TPA: peptidylprolyl isomerase [Gammaproteobacteria bacterium]|nr:peptidylprolyl isomerase [Gammaproteobacteria bacterium]